MDKIDLALQEAWIRIGRACQQDRWEALRRMQRSRRPSVAAPVRPWCLCIRASDTRITSNRAIIEPLEGVSLDLDCGTDDIVSQHVPHYVTLDERAIRRLTQPVRIARPGVPLWEAERMLGMSRGHVRSWVRRGGLKVIRHDYGGVHSRPGKPIPIVIGEWPLDPQMPSGRAPDRVWGTLWQWKCEMLPKTFTMRALREPRFRRWRRKSVFRGWDWVCPGRAHSALSADGSTMTCGRLCKYLYLPLPPCTLAQSIGEFALEMPEESGLAGAWHPGMQHAAVDVVDRPFACKHCWGVRNPSMLKHVGWNEFVAYISGGLLYGREVQRPVDEAAYVRKRRFRKRRTRKTSAGAALSAKRQA